MSKPRAPTPPDPARTAAAQTQSNRDTAIAESYLNNVNQNTPWGSVSYEVSGTGPGGVPRWTQTTNLSPNQQQINDLGEQNSIGLGQLAGQGINTAQGVLGTDWNQRRFNGQDATGGRLNLADALGQYDASRFDPSGGGLNLGNTPNLSGYDPTQALGNFGDDVRARSFSLATQGLGDMFDRSEESLRTRLANQGVNAGTDAFNAEMQSFNRGRGNAYADALLAADSNAMAQRGQAAGELAQGAGLQQWGRADQVGARMAENADQLSRLGMGFDQYSAGRNQQMGELTGERGINWGEALQQYQLDDQADFNARSRPLNEITALNSGSQLYYQPTQAGAPNQYGVANTDIAGIYQTNFNNQMAGYQARMSGQNALLGGLAQLGAAGIQYSDRRLKRDAEYVGEDERGNRIWSYNYIWDDPDAPRRIGVMADEVPHAAIMTTSGYWAVDYGKLGL